MKLIYLAVASQLRLCGDRLLQSYGPVDRHRVSAAASVSVT